MLYIIGGVPRVGKSIISRRLTKDFGIPCFSTDLLVTVLEQAPNYKIKHGQPFISKAKKLWKFFEPLSTHIIYGGEDYVLEGDGILPMQIFKLQKKFPKKVKACFIGIRKENKNEKFKIIRQWEHLPGGDWTKRYPDKDLLKIINKMIITSTYLQKECMKYELPYFEEKFDALYEEVKKVFL